MKRLLLSFFCVSGVLSLERDPFNFKKNSNEDILGYGLVHDSQTKLLIIKKDGKVTVQKKLKKSPSTVKAEGLGG